MKDNFFQNKLSMLICIVLSVGSLIFLEQISAVDFGFLTGVALALSVGVLPRKSLIVCIPMQLLLVTLLAFGLSVGWAFLIMLVLLAFVLMLTEGKERSSWLIIYFMAIFFPSLGMAVGWLFSLL